MLLSLKIRERDFRRGEDAGLQKRSTVHSSHALRILMDEPNRMVEGTGESSAQWPDNPLRGDRRVEGSALADSSR